MSRPLDAFYARHTVPSSRIESGFTLIELLVTVALLSIVAGMVVGLSGGAQTTSETKMIQAELGTIRKACQQYKLDMGEAPHYLAELFQSPKAGITPALDPDTSDSAWAWRNDKTPVGRLREYDPSTRRGWNGPYLQRKQADVLWPDAQTRAKHVGAPPHFRENRVDTAPAADPAVILFSHYLSQSQFMDVTNSITYSHYELDFSDATEVAIVFVSNPTLAPHYKDADFNNEVARLGLGIRP